MEFNYAAEKKKFDEEWAENAKLYAEHGMSPYSIQQMYEYDWNWFKARRIEALHTQNFIDPTEHNEGETGPESPMLEKFLSQFTSEHDTFGSHSRYWWMEELENPCLIYGVSLLTSEDKEILTLAIIERCTAREIGKRMDIPWRTIARKLERIFSLFREYP